MKRSVRPSQVAIALGTTLAAGAFAQQTSLRVFSGGQNQRPDLMRKLFDAYQKANPNVKIDIETGGDTSAVQSPYLFTGAKCTETAR